MSEHRTTCPYCGVGCGLVVKTHDGAVTLGGDPEHPANLGRLCSKGAALAETLDVEGRLLHPQIDGERASWDAALSHVANRFAETIAAHGPDSVAFYVSGQLLTEDYYVANKLMKGFIGSGNIDTNSRLCMASSVAGYKRAFGADFVPNSYRDIENAELLVIVGSNMAWCHPVLFQRARAAKEKKPNMRVVVIDPRRTATCDIADLHLAIRPGSDVALFNGLLAWLDSNGAVDRRFTDASTEGLDAALHTARSSADSPEVVAEACDLEPADVLRFFEWFGATAKTVSLFSQGVNQSTSGTDKVNSIINVHLATGRIGKPGAGPFSLTGQPNAMGGREVGGLANTLAAHMDFSAENIERVGRFWNAPRMASGPGLKAVDLFEEIAERRIRAVWIMSTNPVVSMPNANRVERALLDCDFVVVSDCMRSTDTTNCADVLLPAATWGEKSGTVTNSERRISRQRAFLPTPGEARPDWWIICEVARRMGFEQGFEYSGPAEIFREHASLSAFENDGTRDFDIGDLATLSDSQYEDLQPVRWPVAGSSDGNVIRLTETGFFTQSGRARLIPTVPKATARSPDENYPFILNTGRVRDQWHTMTRTGKSPRLSQTHPEPFVQVHPQDAEALGLVDAGLVRLTSEFGAVQLRVAVSSDVRRGEMFSPMHWSGQFATQARIGSLIEAVCDSVSGQPELKAVPVAACAVQPRWFGFVLSRNPIVTNTRSYVACTRGQGYWRYELAGFSAPEDLSAWARGLLGEDGEWIEFADSGAGRYRAARIIGQSLDSCVFSARNNVLPDRQWLGALFGNEQLDDAQRTDLLAACPTGGKAQNGPVVCACFSVARNQLIDAIQSQRLTDAAAIGAVLSAGTNCGSCIPELNSLIAEFAESTLDAAAHQGP